MGMLDVAKRLADAKKATIVPPNKEYELQLFKVVEGKSEDYDLEWNSYLFAVLNPPKDIPLVSPISVFIWIDDKDKIIRKIDEAGQKSGKARDGVREAEQNDVSWREMLEALGVDYSKPFNPIELADNRPTAWAILGTREDNRGDTVNTIKQWIGRK